MLDLGTSFLASVARTPRALAIVDGDLRLSYEQWYPRISAVVAGLQRLGLQRGDHLLTVLQNRWQAATLHWACQFAGIIITPLNGRAKAEEIDYAIADAEAKAVVFEAISAEATRAAQAVPRITLDAALHGETSFDTLLAAAPPAQPQAGAEDWSVMLYTSGTTSRPKGVPRRHRAERAAAIAHVAQNLYGADECTLGVMPLYHTMGVRSLLAMACIGGAFICQPRFDVAEALRLIQRERITNLYLVPTLYHDLLHHPAFATTDTSSVRKLGFAGAMHYSVTGADNARFIARIYDRPLQETVDFVEDFADLGSDVRMPVRTYSSGMIMRLGFALSLAVRFDCYLVDEAIAVGDSRFGERARAALADLNARSALLLVSHQAETVRAFCKTAAILQDGRLTRYDDLDEAIAAYQAA
jgi:acyl-CoA synthetase (AMP-forming)/AMP-acid ligase II